MNKRDQDLNKIRPELSSVPTLNKSPEEDFQNKSLRPIIKLQNELLIEVFRNYLLKHRIEFRGLAAEKQVACISNATQKDIKFRNSLKGMIIGHFTLEEYRYYITNSSSINKRIIKLITQRLEDNVQLFATTTIGEDHL